jgi:hypothetical protein
MPPHDDDDWSDDDELEGDQLESSVLLGVPDGSIESAQDIADAAVSRIGGLPVRYFFCTISIHSFDCLCKGVLTSSRTPV